MIFPLSKSYHWNVRLVDRQSPFQTNFSARSISLVLCSLQIFGRVLTFPLETGWPVTARLWVIREYEVIPGSPGSSLITSWLAANKNIPQNVPTVWQKNHAAWPFQFTRKPWHWQNMCALIPENMWPLKDNGEPRNVIWFWRDRGCSPTPSESVFTI